MNKFLRGLVFLFIFLIPVAFYYFYHPKNEHSSSVSQSVKHGSRPVSPAKRNGKVLLNPAAAPAPAVVPPVPLPEIAMIFDDLGESLRDVRELYSLGVPLTVAIIPGLKHSEDIAYVAKNCGFSIMVHLPLEPSAKANYTHAQYKFITRRMSDRNINALLRYYLHGVPSAIGVNNHMGSAATQDRHMMDIVLDNIKQNNLIFIDSRTSLESIAYDMALKKGIVAGQNQGFIDAVMDVPSIEKKLDHLAQLAQEQGKILIIGHPRKTTIAALKNKLPLLKTKVRFITLKEYFGK